MALPAFAATCHAAVPCCCGAGRAAYDRYLLPAGPTAANPSHAAAAGEWDRRTDTVPFHRPCAAYYTGSANNSLSNEQTQYRTHKTYVPTPANIVEQLMTISSRDVFSARFHRPWRRPSNKYSILSLIYSEFLSQTYSANHRRQVTEKEGHRSKATRTLAREWPICGRHSPTVVYFAGQAAALVKCYYHRPIGLLGGSPGRQASLVCVPQPAMPPPR